MIELITIKDEQDLYLERLENNKPIFTMNLNNIMSFDSLEKAEEFAKLYLNNTECYEIINLKMDIKLDETTLKTINFQPL